MAETPAPAHGRPDHTPRQPAGPASRRGEAEAARGGAKPAQRPEGRPAGRPDERQEGGPDADRRKPDAGRADPPAESGGSRGKA